LDPRETEKIFGGDTAGFTKTLMKYKALKMSKHLCSAVDLIAMQG
jgi:hypothetical protein